MNVNTFVFAAYAILSTRFLRLYKPYTQITHRISKLPGYVIHTHHTYNQIALYASKPAVRKRLLFRSGLRGNDRWFQTTASNEYRFRRRGVMDSDGCDAVGSGAMKRRHSIPKSHDGAMTSGNSGQRRACPATEESGMDGYDPAPDSQDTVVERKDELAVFIGNLRTDVCDATLKESIMGVFAVAGVNISASQVMLVHKAFATHAFVYLTSADEKTWALKGFGSQLDLSSIAIPGKKLKVRSKSFGAVSYRRPEHSSMQMSALTERSSIDSSGSSALLLDNDGASYLPGAMLIIDENSSDDSEVVNADDIHLVHPQKAALTSKAPHAQHREQSPSQVTTSFPWQCKGIQFHQALKIKPKKVFYYR